eukprot:gene30176-37344_t
MRNAMNDHLDLADKPATADVHREVPDTAAVRAAPVTLTRQLSAEQAFRRIAANCREQIAANHAAVARGNAPEALHQMRVGLRRLRSALDLYAPLLELPEALRADLRWLGEQLGAARDWDVLASSTLPRMAESLPDDMELVLVRLAAETRANDLRAAAADAVSTERYAELMRNLGGWLHDAGWRGHCTARHHKVAQQAREALDLHLRVLARGLADHLDALFQAEQGFFVVPCGHSHDDLAKQLGGSAHHVFMAQGDGVKGSGVNGEDVVGHGGLSPVLTEWSLALCRAA